MEGQSISSLIDLLIIWWLYKYNMHNFFNTNSLSISHREEKGGWIFTPEESLLSRSFALKWEHSLLSHGMWSRVVRMGGKVLIRKLGSNIDQLVSGTIVVLHVVLQQEGFYLSA